MFDEIKVFIKNNKSDQPVVRLLDAGNNIVAVTNMRSP